MKALAWMVETDDTWLVVFANTKSEARSEAKKAIGKLPPGTKVSKV